MKYFKILPLFLSLLCMSISAQEIESVEFLSKYKIPGISIRALEVTDGQSLWFAGSKGRYGRIINEKFEIDSIIHMGKFPEFRSIASNGEYLFLLSIENPALMYKIDPKKPLGKYELVYEEYHPKVFYDSMKFFDKEKGIAMGDPTENCLSVIRTIDGGENWKKLPCLNIPENVAGEAAFAASNSNVTTFKNKSWIVSGGTKARVFRSEDYGENWQVSETPIKQGGKMTGIFTIDFYDSNVGIIMGGDWENKSDGLASKALSTDGGETWNLIAQNGLPGYISCVQFVPDGSAHQILATSTEGIYYSYDHGNNWKLINQNGFYSLRFIDNETAWLSKNEEIAKIKLQ